MAGGMGMNMNKNMKMNQPGMALRLLPSMLVVLLGDPAPQGIFGIYTGTEPRKKTLYLRGSIKCAHIFDSVNSFPRWGRVPFPLPFDRKCFRPASLARRGGPVLLDPLPSIPGTFCLGPWLIPNSILHLVNCVTKQWF